MKDYSIIIPVKNDAENIRNILESLLKQEKETPEIIIVDGASKDGTVDKIKDLPIKIIVDPRPGGSLARNLGINDAKGKMLLFTDADCIACDDWIEQHLKSLEKFDVVMGKTVLHPDNEDSIIAKSLEYGLLPYFDFPFFSEEEDVERTLPFWNLYTSNLSMNRKILDDVGMMDENFKMVGSEDTEFGYRISKKYQIGYNPKAIIYHKHKKSFKSAMRRAVIAGRQSAFMKFKVPVKNRRGIIFSRLKKLLKFKNLSRGDRLGILVLSGIFLAGFLYGYLTFRKMYTEM